MQKAAQIAKGSMLFESHIDVQHRNPKVQGVHHFVAPVEFDGKLWRVQLLVKDIVENRNDRAVVHTIDGIDIREMGNPPGGVNLSEGGVSYVDGVAAAATDELANTESVPKTVPSVYQSSQAGASLTSAWGEFGKNCRHCRTIERQLALSFRTLNHFPEENRC